MQPTSTTENSNTKHRGDSNSTKQVKLHFLPTTQPQFYKENTVSSKLGRFLMYSNKQMCHTKVKISNVYFDIRKLQDGSSNLQNFKNNTIVKLNLVRILGSKTDRHRWSWVLSQEPTMKAFVTHAELRYSIQHTWEQIFQCHINNISKWALTKLLHTILHMMRKSRVEKLVQKKQNNSVSRNLKRKLSSWFWPAQSLFFLSSQYSAVFWVLPLLPIPPGRWAGSSVLSCQLDLNNYSLHNLFKYQHIQAKISFFSSRDLCPRAYTDISAMPDLKYEPWRIYQS